MIKISAVINTRNEEANLPRAIASLKKFADEIIVVDMKSEDGTVEAAKRLGAKVYLHKNVGYVEPARNFAISKATGDWIFILDADEEIPAELARVLKGLPRGDRTGSLRVAVADYYRIPRKNIIFGKWIKHTYWWPDYQIRFFKKGFVSWSNEIHSLPITKGKGADFPAKDKFAIIHNNYNFFDQYIERLFRYTKIQAEELIQKGYVFRWEDVIRKPLGEFLRRFFEGKGYQDGVHGLILSLLQAFSELIVYARVWEKRGFKSQKINQGEIKKELQKAIKDLNWWMRKEFSWLKSLVWR